ncbi:hypothetical protein BTZ20_2367 [Rhodococcus sp. MTM3W5.2]|nr:hypothetical protein BTZ20_2367 [Rhodococcus sp. MTM3W5.2]
MPSGGARSKIEFSIAAVRNNLDRLDAHLDHVEYFFVRVESENSPLTPHRGFGVS